MRHRKICIVGMDSYGLLSGEGDLQVHRRRNRAARAAGARLARPRPRSVDDRVRRRAGRASAWSTASPSSRRISATAASRACDSSIRAPPNCSRRCMAADADVYYQSPAGAFTGITAWFCRMTGRKFIFRVASDSDCEKEHGRIELWRDRKLYDYGLQARRPGRSADRSPGAACCARTTASKSAWSTCWSSRRAAAAPPRRTSTCCG